jgi:hypothetical protein
MCLTGESFAQTSQKHKESRAVLGTYFTQWLPSCCTTAQRPYKLQGPARAKLSACCHERAVNTLPQQTVSLPSCTTWYTPAHTQQLQPKANQTYDTTAHMKHRPLHCGVSITQAPPPVQALYTSTLCERQRQKKPPSEPHWQLSIMVGEFPKHMMPL